MNSSPGCWGWARFISGLAGVFGIENKQLLAVEGLRGRLTGDAAWVALALLDAPAAFPGPCRGP